MPQNNVVLARKYRPQIFADLLGQEALVQTITNAIQQNKLAQAYLLTGIRGIGKTTSARIIAKGLNCIGEDGQGGMTPNPCGKCRHCIDITNDSDIDVIEIDAASNTGVDNIREIIEGAKYNPVSARFKIYIIDEVHMLSKAAFNALLKTLEEPPERVKFIFATTEIRKVPITIVSRCQRFDLKRISEKPLAEYLQKIAKLEKADLPLDVALLLSHAAEGSVRDSLSLLDQTLVHFQDEITLKNVQKMLGLADRETLFSLYEDMLLGNIQSVFNNLEEQYALGAEPLQILQDLMTLTYDLTCAKALKNINNNTLLLPHEKVKIAEMAEKFSMGTLTLFWQLLTKASEEIKRASNPLHSLQMVLIRLMYASQILDSPEKMLAQVKEVPSSFASVSIQTKEVISKQQPPAEPVPPPAFHSMAELAELARTHAEQLLGHYIESAIHLISLENKKISCSFAPSAPKTLAVDLLRFLEKLTGEKWILDVQKVGGNPTEKEKKVQKEKLAMDHLKERPDVNSILKQFPGAKIDKITPVAPVIEADLEEEEE